MGSRYLLQPIESALGRSVKATACNPPLWADLGRNDIVCEEKFPALARMSDVDSLLSRQRVCIVVGRENQGKTALVRMVGYRHTQARQDVWYLDMAQPGYQDLTAIYETMRHYDTPENLFIVDNCHANLADAQSILEFLLRETHRALFVLAVSFHLTEKELQRFLISVSGEQLIRIGLGIDASPAALQSIVTPITVEMLGKARAKAEEDLSELQDLRSTFGANSREYTECFNSKSFIGHMPEWRHLYMGAFGAFPRPQKERELLEALDANLGRLSERRNGVLLHVISGDSGSGKSALARLLMRRICEQLDLDSYPNLSKSLASLRIFEIGRTSDWDSLGDALRVNLQPTSQGHDLITLLFFDDLFAEEREDIQKLFGTLGSIADTSKIYFIVTSPSWLFSRRELQFYRREHNLVDTIETVVGALDHKDRDSLKSQYIEIYGDECRSDLISVIDQESDIILIKLALHQNLHYSEYLRHSFESLKRKGLERYLAALLLLSTVSRFYVHLPINVVHKINESFGLTAKDKLPELSSDYATFSVLGFRLFRVREGSQDQSVPAGVPDTIAPLHDRIAQVIYSTWGDEDVPLLGVKLWELSNRVLDAFDQSPSTQTLLANVFRGMLRSHTYHDPELNRFVTQYGPVRHGSWTLIDNPYAAHRWITYAKYRPDRTRIMQQLWLDVLHKTKSQDPDRTARVGLLTLLIRPGDNLYLTNRTWMTGVPSLGQDCFCLILGVLDEFLGLQPFRLDPVIDYLSYLCAWLDQHASAVNSGLTSRYQVLRSLTQVNFQLLRMQKQLSSVLRHLVWGYLKNIGTEYKTYDVLGSDLVRSHRWSSSESQELSQAILTYVRNESNWHRAAVFESYLAISDLQPPGALSPLEVFELYVQICVQLPEFSGLSFTSEEYGRYLTRLSAFDPHRYAELLRHIGRRLSSAGLDDFAKTKAYPGFIQRYLEHAGSALNFEVPEVIGFMRPLAQYHEDSSAMRFAFRVASKLITVPPDYVMPVAQDAVEAQVRLCLAEALHVPLGSAFQGLTDLLEQRQIMIPYAVCSSLAPYLETTEDRVDSQSLIEYRRRLYSWLRGNMNDAGAVPLFKLCCSGLLFSKADMVGLDRLAQRALEQAYVGWLFDVRGYMHWWLSEPASASPKEQRHTLLDAYWEYLITYSRHDGKDTKRPLAQLEYLLKTCGIETDEAWWSRAIRRLVIFYGIPATDRRSHPRRGKRLERGDVMEETPSPRQDYLDCMIEIILKNFRSVEGQLQGSFYKALQEALLESRNQEWAKYWIVKLNLGLDIAVDPTQSFLSFLDSTKRDISESSIIGIKERAREWHDLIAGRDPEVVLGDLARVFRWLEYEEHLRVSLYAMVAILDLFPEEVVQFNCGRLVSRVVRGADAEFRFKWTLVSHYVQWLDNHAWRMLDDQTKELTEILEWFAQKSLETRDTHAVLLGLMTLFEQAAKYSLEVQPSTLDRLFINTIEAFADDSEGGELAEKYFTWRLQCRENLDVSSFVRWVESHVTAGEAPRVMAHLLVALINNPEALYASFANIGELWHLLKLLIKKRLADKGTEAAVEAFSWYLVYFQDTHDGGTLLETISGEFYQLCLQLADDPRVLPIVMNLPALNPDLVELPSIPTPEQVFNLWQRLNLPIQVLPESGDLPRFIRNIDAYLSEDEALRNRFREDLVDRLEKSPDHWLWPTIGVLFLDDSEFVQEHPDSFAMVSKTLHDQIRLRGDLRGIEILIRHYLKCRETIVPADEMKNEERSLIAVLEAHSRKRGFEECMLEVIGGCSPPAHCQELGKAIRSHLEGAKDTYGQSRHILEAYHEYVEESQKKTGENLQQKLAEDFLIAIGTNESHAGPIQFSRILQIWGHSGVSQDVASNSLKALLTKRNSRKLDSLLAACRSFQKLFGAEAQLTPRESVEDVIQLLQREKEATFAAVRKEVDAKALESLPE